MLVESETIKVLTAVSFSMSLLLRRGLRTISIVVKNRGDLLLLVKSLVGCLLL